MNESNNLSNYITKIVSIFYINTIDFFYAEILNPEQTNHNHLKIFCLYSHQPLNHQFFFIASGIVM